MSQACPLCGSGSTVVIGQLKRADLRRIWIRNLGIDPVEWIARPTIEYQHCGTCDLRYFDDELAGPEEMYRKLEKFPWYYLDYKPEFEVAKRDLKGAERILEIGAGEGAFGRLISRAGGYVGLELNSFAADRAAASGLDVRRESLVDHATSAHDSYDAVVAFQVLEHVRGVGSFIRDCLRCLKPGGRLIISVPSHDGFMGVELNSILDLPPHHLTQWSDRCMSEIASQFDLTLVTLEHDEIAPYHRANYLRQKLLDQMGFRRTDERPVRASSAFHGIEQVASKVGGAWGRMRRPALPRGFGHSVTACYGVGSPD
jgi:SAM-dependent methyltransferase